MMASSTASEIWSQILSGCPSVTDSEVKKYLLIFYILSTLSGRVHKKTPAGRRGMNYAYIASSFVTAGFGTLQTQVAGLHRAVPSTSLDKVFNFNVSIITDYTGLSIV